MKVLIVTSYAAAAEPRAVRNSIAARQAFPNAEIVFLDRVARGNAIKDPAAFEVNRIGRASLEVTTKRFGLFKRAIELARSKLAARSFQADGSVQEALFGPTAIGLTREIAKYRPDVVIAHTAQTLPAALDYCRRHNAPLIFDVSEFYSDMGDSQSQIEALATVILEREAYQRADLLLTTSEQLAKVLCKEFGATNILVSLNVPPLAPSRPPPGNGNEGLKLYWRNSTVALSQRGLGDALEAMQHVPSDVDLFVQGRTSRDIAKIEMITRNLGVADRVHILPPFTVGNAVEAARPYDIGLCLERPGPRNHELTISNKFFDYHMAGLAVIASNMPSLATALERSGGGLTYRAGSAQSLAETIVRLRDDRELLRQLRSSARRFALDRGNLEFELRQLSNHFRIAVEANLSRNNERHKTQQDRRRKAWA